MKDIQLYRQYLTRDGHRVRVEKITVKYDGLMTEITGYVSGAGGPILPRNRSINWNAEGRFVGSMAGEEHALDIVREA
jgi:hypothetical protein